MVTATLTSRGRITIPAEVRSALKIDSGDQIEFVLVAPGRYELTSATCDVSALKGMFGPARQAVSIAAMNRAIAKRATNART